MRARDYLDKVKALTPTGSVYAAAQLLDLKENTVRTWHLGSGYPDAYGCTRIAELLDLDPMKVIADIEAEREKDEGRRAYWRELARKLACWGLVTGLSATGFYGSSTEGATAIRPETSSPTLTNVQIMRQFLRRFLQLLGGLKLSAAM